MNSKAKTFLIFLSFAVFALLACAGSARAQTVRRAEAAPVRTPDAIRVAAVNERSPAVDLKAGGRKVAPGVLEVSPDAVRGKRLILPSGGSGKPIKLCIGLWIGSDCLGTYIELDDGQK